MVTKFGMHCRSNENHLRNSQISGKSKQKNVFPGIISTDTLLVIVKEDSESETFEWTALEEIHHEQRCTSISFAPETSLAVIPKVVKLGTAGVDFKLRIFHSNLDSKPTVQVLQGKFLIDLPMAHSAVVVFS